MSADEVLSMGTQTQNTLAVPTEMRDSKRCRECGTELNSQSQKSYLLKHGNICTDCSSEAVKKWKRENTDSVRVYYRGHARKYRANQSAEWRADRSAKQSAYYAANRRIILDRLKLRYVKRKMKIKVDLMLKAVAHFKSVPECLYL